MESCQRTHMEQWRCLVYACQHHWRLEKDQRKTTKTLPLLPLAYHGSTVMLNKEVCMYCRNTTPIGYGWEWEPEHDLWWDKGSLLCQYAPGARWETTKKPPSNCPFRLEHTLCHDREEHVILSATQ